MRIRGARRGFDRCGGRVGAAVGDVGADGVVKEDRLLRHDAVQRAQVGEPEIARVHPIHGDAPLGGVVETREEIGERALAAAARPDERHHVAGPDLEIDVAQHRLAGCVRERDVLHPDRRRELPHRLRLRAIGDLHGRVEQLEGALGGGEPRLHRGRILGDELDGRHELAGEHQRRDEPRGSERPLLEHQIGAVPEQGENRRRRDHLRSGREELPPPLVLDQRAVVPSGEVAEAALLPPLGARCLHEADAAHRLLELRRHLTHGVEDAQNAPVQSLAEARPEAEHRRQEDERHQRELPGEEHQRDEEEDRLEHRGEELGQIVRDHRAHLIHIHGHARDDLSGARLLEERQTEPDEMGVDVVAEVARDAPLDHGRGDVLDVERHVLHEEHHEQQQHHVAQRDHRRRAADEVAHGPLEHPLDGVPAAEELRGTRQPRAALKEDVEEGDEQREAERVERGEAQRRTEACDHEADVRPEVAEQAAVEASVRAGSIHGRWLPRSLPGVRAT